MTLKEFQKKEGYSHQRLAKFLGVKQQAQFLGGPMAQGCQANPTWN